MEHDWKISDLVFLALNLDSNKRRTNKKEADLSKKNKGVNEDFDDMLEEILAGYNDKDKKV